MLEGYSYSVWLMPNNGPPCPNAQVAAFAGHQDFYAADFTYRDAVLGVDENPGHAHIPARAGDYLFAADSDHDYDIK